MGNTYDFASARDRMEAVDLALQCYFDTKNWLDAREKQMPGLGKKK